MARLDMTRAGEEPATEAAAPDVAPQDRRAHAALPATIALTVSLALGGVAVLMAAVMAVVDPVPIRGLGIAQRQDAETLVYVVTFLVLLPAALWAGPRVADAVSERQGDRALSALSASLVAGLAAAILLTRLLAELGGGIGILLVLALVWALAAAAAIRRATVGRWPLLLRLADKAPLVWCLAAVVVAAAPWTVAKAGSISLLPLVAGAALVAGITWLYVRFGPRRLRGGTGLAVDVAAAAAIVLVAVDLVVMPLEGSSSALLDAYNNWTMRFHANFLLGPANDVLGGGTLLVDVASQYGVGSIYFVAGWFQLFPAGYGTFGLLDGALTSLWLLAGYAVLRMAGCSRALAAVALATALVSLVLARPYSVGTLLQEGPLRFGLPMPVIVAAVAAARWPRWAGAARIIALIALGIASIWSLESFATTLVVFASLVALEAFLAGPGERRRLIAARATAAAVACICAHAALAAATLAFAGELPDWTQYIAYLRAFLLGDLGDVTYDFSPWSPGLALGAGYVASAAAVVLLLRRGRALVEAQRVTFVALTGTTVYGIVLLMYLVDRSADHVVAYVALPALLAAVLWLGLVLRSRRLERSVRAGALAVGLSVAVLLVSVAWSAAGSTIDRTALAHVLPGGESPRAALTRLYDLPPLDPHAATGERLLRRHLPGEAASLVMVNPDLRTELLLRTGRTDALGLAYPWGDGFVPDERLPGMHAAIDRLRPGQRMLTNTAALRAAAQSARIPEGELDDRYAPPQAPLAPLQLVAMREIARRFRLEPVHRGPQGYVIVRLAPKA